MIWIQKINFVLYKMPFWLYEFVIKYHIMNKMFQDHNKNICIQKEHVQLQSRQSLCKYSKLNNIINDTEIMIKTHLCRIQNMMPVVILKNPGRL